MQPCPDGHLVSRDRINQHTGLLSVMAPGVGPPVHLSESPGGCSVSPAPLLPGSPCTQEGPRICLGSEQMKGFPHEPKQSRTEHGAGGDTKLAKAGLCPEAPGMGQ